ncbi:MAG TPA: hypothetical protein VNH64_11025 [Parvularculaceae bacterium]|nr:hypothetical protein [Parvularculaceae bacterium]
MAAAFKARIRESIYYRDGLAAACAPSGEYDISCAADNEIAFKSRSGACAFTLSLDALAQHLSEGRISLIGGRALPPVCAQKIA